MINEYPKYHTDVILHLVMFEGHPAFYLRGTDLIKASIIEFKDTG